MEFDKSRVYTAVNADELNTGDLVYVSYNFRELKNIVEAEDKEDLKYIYFIRPDEMNNRFYVGDDDYGGKYILAYRVCPARNVEAYKAWKEGKAVEVTPYNPKHPYTRIENDGEEPDWTQGYYRPIVEQPKEKKYRPFKNCKELCDFWYTKTAANVPSYAMPLIWVKRKVANSTMLITAFNDDTFSAVSVDSVTYTFADLLDKFTFLDGTPCGVEE